MTIHLTADLHLGHERILELSNRPFATVEEMNDTLIANYNARVNRGDLVFIVGDFAWRDHAKYLSALKGRKILIVGDHDRMSQIAMRQFQDVHQKLETKIQGQYVTLCHHPLVSWAKSFHGSWHFHGHSHGRLEEPSHKLCCDIGVDVWDYAPIPWEVLRKRMTDKIPAWQAYHDSFDGDPNANVQALRAKNQLYLRNP